MKKSYNPTDLHQQQGQEHSKKLYRSVSESAKRLDDGRSCANNVGDLFTPSLQIQRSKFREYCERLIFSDSILFGRKAEELLWRKGYYDVVSTAKRLKKIEYTAEETSSLHAHINAGIGHYHHFIARLQTEFDVDLRGNVDFAIFSESSVKTFKKDKREEQVEWAKQSVHRSLVYLGDLCRYKLEIYPNWDQCLAIRYYMQALYFKPDHGVPHNQMGTLASNHNHCLNAAYHYIRCLSCKHVFEGTENNLHRLLEKNSQFLEQMPVENENSDCIIQPDPVDHIKRFIARFLLLTDIWFFDKKVPHIYNLCHQTNVDLLECLQYLKHIPSESGDTQTDLDSVETDSTTSPSYLSSDVIFKIIVICLLSISKLQKLQSQQISTVVAFTLAVYSQLIQNVIVHIQESVVNFPLPNLEFANLDAVNGLCVQKKAKKSRSNLRRRRASQNSSEESDLSDAESSSDASIISEDERFSDPSDDESDLENRAEIDTKLVNGTLNESDNEQTSVPSKVEADNKISPQEIISKAKRMDPNDMLQIVTEEGLLHSIKILSEWLSSDFEVLKACGKNTRSLLNQIVHLLNLINLDLTNPKFKELKLDVHTLITDQKKIALPEDVILKGVEILANSQQNIDWNYFDNYVMSPKEEALLRVIELIAFGHLLTTFEECGVTYDDNRKMFVAEPDSECDEINGLLTNISDADIAEEDNKLKPSKNDDIQKKDDETGGQLLKMKHMGQLWLAAEVRALESRVKGKTSLSPYLVLDADSLIKYISLVRQLVYSRKFIVVVPSAVVSALDDLKREKLEARDAIRWLESQFHQGNRFFRAQRAHERSPIPLIKYPKKKDKEVFIYIQIIECCHYLAEQQKGATDLVTLVMGNPKVLSTGENKDISYIGLAQSAGVNLELITEFHAKWKKTSKGKR